jgi:hypothetical protein
MSQYQFQVLSPCICLHAGIIIKIKKNLRFEKLTKAVRGSREVRRRSISTGQAGSWIMRPERTK